MKHLFFVCCLGMCLILHAQFGSQQIITIDAIGARSVYAADLDGDGDMDVLSASEGDNKVAWYENINGMGTFGTEQIITTNLHAAVDVFASDLDGDNDLDIVVASKGNNPDDGKVVWFENLDGLGDFGFVQNITTLTEGALSVFAADLDGDNDMDVLSASFTDNTLAWYENTDGLGNFGEQQIINSAALSVRDIVAADLDGDGDMDVLGAVPGIAGIIWHENIDGLGYFGPEQIITTNALTALSVYVADIDDDDDLDVLSASPVDDKVAWYENLDGLGSFGAQQVISTGIEGERIVRATDIDKDGDIDVLSTSQLGLGDNVAWYENLDGLGNFSTHQIISEDIQGGRDVFTADLDNDGDIDVLSASIGDYKIAWYENLTILNVDENLVPKFLIQPNPVNDILTINNSFNIKIESIKIFDAIGRLLLQEKEQFTRIDISNLNRGLLFVQFLSEKGIITKKIVKK